MEKFFALLRDTNDISARLSNMSLETNQKTLKSILESKEDMLQYCSTGNRLIQELVVALKSDHIHIDLPKNELLEYFADTFPDQMDIVSKSRSSDIEARFINGDVGALETLSRLEVSATISSTTAKSLIAMMKEKATCSNTMAMCLKTLLLSKDYSSKLFSQENIREAFILVAGIFKHNLDIQIATRLMEHLHYSFPQSFTSNWTNFLQALAKYFASSDADKVACICRIFCLFEPKLCFQIVLEYEDSLCQWIHVDYKYSLDVLKLVSHIAAYKPALLLEEVFVLSSNLPKVRHHISKTRQFYPLVYSIISQNSLDNILLQKFRSNILSNEEMMNSYKFQSFDQHETVTLKCLICFLQVVVLSREEEISADLSCALALKYIYFFPEYSEILKEFYTKNVRVHSIIKAINLFDTNHLRDSRQSEMQSELDGLRKETSLLKEKFEETETKIKALASQQEEQEIIIDGLQSHIQQLEKEKNTLNEILKEKEAVLQTKARILTEADSKRQEIEDQLIVQQQEHEFILNKLKAEAEEHQSDFEFLQNSNQEFRDNLSAAEKEIAKLKHQLETRSSELKSAQKNQEILKIALKKQSELNSVLEDLGKDYSVRVVDDLSQL